MTYSFKDHDKADIRNLIMAINVLGENLVGLELGVLQAESLMTILHNCSIKKLYGVDHWKGYTDYLSREPNYQPVYTVSDEDAEYNKLTALHRIKHSGMKDKVVIIEGDSLNKNTIDYIEDKSLDFIFFDAMLDEDQAYKEALAYYPKLKVGGYLMGDDAFCEEQVIIPLNKVLKHYKNTNPIITYGRCFMIKI
tara:strand:- start:54 stop:635 length:582 start_codon:yes stop_codon:yes gene_type:complete